MFKQLASVFSNNVSPNKKHNILRFLLGLTLLLKTEASPLEMLYIKSRRNSYLRQSLPNNPHAKPITSSQLRYSQVCICIKTSN